MSLRAVILVPAQGHHAQQFHWSARALRSSVYGGHALIVDVEVVAPRDYNQIYQGLNNFQVKLRTDHGKPFSFADHRNLASMLTISHAATADGPNMAAGIGGYQPWAAYDAFGRDGSPYGGAGGSAVSSEAVAVCSMQTLNCQTDPAVESPRRPFTYSALRPKARAFWEEIGRSLRGDGKIILIGCNLGAGHYIDHVANASGHPTYGASAPFSAADVKTVVRVVKGIERGIAFEPMRKAMPER